MERNREARRMMNGGLSSSSSSSRRRPRTGSSSLRDSPEEDGGMELQETRLRERGKKDRDRDRSGRSKRRTVDRGAMLMAMAVGREDGEDTSDDSADDDEEDEYEDNAIPQQQQSVRLPPAPPPLPQGNPLGMQNQSSSSPNHHHHSHHNSSHQQTQQQPQHRKGVVAAAVALKAPRVAGVWKAAADEMIGVSVPRKARTASAKRSHECWVSGSGGGGREGGVGGGAVEVVHRQASTSPARPSLSSSAPISPSSSNVSIRKKLKPSRENKHRPPKISKPQTSSEQDIEFEVAEVLFGMTRQLPGPPKKESASHKFESKEAPNGSGTNEAKSRVSSPNSISASSPSLAPLLPLLSNAAPPGVVAPKRKRPRAIKPEEENLSSPSNPASLAPPPGKVEGEQIARIDLPSAKSEKMPSLLEKMAISAVDNGVAANEELRPHPDTDAQEMVKIDTDKVCESRPPEIEVEAGEVVPAEAMANEEPKKQISDFEDVKHDETSEKKLSPHVGSPGKEKFEIDLMAPPPGKPSTEDEAVVEFGVDNKVMVREETGKKVEKLEEARKAEMAKMDGVGSGLQPKAEAKSTSEEMSLRKLPSKEPIFELQLEMAKQDKDESCNSRPQQQQKMQPLSQQQQQKQLPLQPQQQQAPQQQQQSKPPRTDKSEKSVSVQPGGSSTQMSVPGWHGGLPPFGCMGQVPSLVPMDGSGTGTAKPMQAPPMLVQPQRSKRCATHYYIAQCIQYHQQLQQLSRLWPAAAAAGATAFLGAKPQYNVNGMQPTDSVPLLGNTMQGGAFPPRNIGSLQDMGNPAVAAAFGGLASKDKNPVAVNATLDSSQRKQLVMQQTPQGVSGNNMLAPAFVFPFNQQQAAAAAAAAAALNRPGVPSKSGSGASATSTPTSAPGGSSAVPASGAATVSYNYPNLPPGEAPFVAILQNNAYPFPITAAHVGGPQFRGSNPQAMPFFSSSFYPSQMLHPAQLQQQQASTTQQQQASTTQQQHQSQQNSTAPSGQQGRQNNKSTSSGSSSSQQHLQQQHPQQQHPQQQHPQQQHPQQQHPQQQHPQQQHPQQQHPPQQHPPQQHPPQQHPPQQHPPQQHPQQQHPQQQHPQQQHPQQQHPQQQHRQQQHPQQQHPQQRIHGSVSGASSSHGFPTKQLSQQLPIAGRPAETETVGEDTPSSADSSRVPSAHKGVSGLNFPVPVHPQNFALMSSTSDKQANVQQPPSSQNSPSQAFTVSFPSLNGVTPPLGIEFSTSQNHPLLQSIPEGARQGYQMAAATAVAASPAAHQKKSEGKPSAEPTEEERKAMASTKSPVNFSQHSLAFASAPASLPNNTMDSSRPALNLIQPPSNNSRSSNRPASATPSSAASGGGAAASFGMHHHQQQQQPLIVQQQLQRHQQQIFMQQQQLLSRPKTASAAATSSPTLYTTERHVSSAAVPKFPNHLGGFPQAVVVQGGTAGAATTSQANQWKNTTRSGTQLSIPSQSQSTISSSVKNQMTQQQGRVAPQSSSLPNQTQISFSVAAGNTQKLQQQSGQQLTVANSTGNPSPQPSAAKGSGGGNGSPRSSVIGKQGPLSGSLPLQHQSQQSKCSPTNSVHKSSPVSSSRNAPSILGQPHIPLPPQGSSSKSHMDPMQFQHGQLYFSGAYMTAPSSQAYFQRHQQQQSSSQQQPNSTSTSAGMLSLCPSSALSLGGATATAEPGKSMAAPNMKNMPSQTLLQAAQLAAAAHRPLVSASGGFPYVHTVSSVSVKPVEQKPAATGNH